MPQSAPWGGMGTSPLTLVLLQFGSWVWEVGVCGHSPCRLEGQCRALKSRGQQWPAGCSAETVMHQGVQGAM